MTVDTQDAPARDFACSTAVTDVTPTNTTLLRFDKLNAPILFEHGRLERITTLVDATDHNGANAPMITFRNMQFTTDYKPTTRQIQAGALFILDRA